MQELGLSSHLGELNKVMRSDERYEVLEENWPIVEWFIETEDLYLWNQNVCLGLDVKAVRDDAFMSGREFTSEQYKGLRIMGRTFADEITKICTMSK